MAARIGREVLEVSSRQNGPTVGDPRRAGHMVNLPAEAVYAKMAEWLARKEGMT
ncbi:hypothetical protein ACVMB3_005188 [Sinorhizobium meliloti]|nr:hypothetical protein [Sinorhizobium meliloti]AEG07113.1 hypothetical protein SinmeB_5944 [Sinorhizobium meliloti BL225C]AEG07143.1 hypothetical protein SinmeB_5982 [Sinorhizobium meliloti BL225C]MDE3774666.1 hypothetical protein [Sinorhizobium meliloti]MDE3774698.1 hypothetical protein [Sinorhizobium meliloti]QND34430.1 hypothetical protein HB772_20075 [Sinorhizobium meliloti]